MIRKQLALWAAVLAVSGGLTGVTTASAQTPEPTVEEMKAQLKAMNDRLNLLEESIRTRPTDAEINRTRDAVKVDAANKATNVSVTYDKGLIFKAGDDFSLRPSLYSQFRYTASLGDGPGNERRDDQNGFEFRRVRPRIQGNVLNKDLTYDVQFDVNREGGNTTLLDLNFVYKLADEWAVKFGQYKESVFHERDVSSSRQLAAERSLLDTVLGGGDIDRVQGVAFIYGGTKNNPVRAEFGVTDGANTVNTDFRDKVNGAGVVITRQTDYGVSGRAEYKAMGDWASYRDFTAKGTKENLLVFGAGADYTQSGDLNAYRGGADVQFENASGLGLFASFVGDYFDLGNNSAGSDNSFDYGGLAQIGYLVAPAWEIFARGGAIYFDAAPDDYYPEATVGVNYFLGRDGSWLHNAKITLDATYLPNGFPETQTGTGTIAADDAEYVFRFQFQIIL